MRRFGANSLTLFGATALIGNVGSTGAVRAGRFGLRKSTLPAGPKSAGVLFGSMLRLMVRPWLLPHVANVEASSRRLLMAYPARRTLCPLLPIRNASGP